MIYKHVFWKKSLIQSLWYTHEAQQPACFSCCRDYCFYSWPDCGCPGAGVWVRGRWGSQKPSSAQAGIQPAAIPILPLADSISGRAGKPHKLWFKWGKRTSLWHCPLGLVWRQLCCTLKCAGELLQALGWCSAKKISWLLALSDPPSLVIGREILYFC